MKPFINLNHLENGQSSSQGIYGETYFVVSELIGAKRLGYSVSVVPPGKRVCPFHNHRVNEEMFLVLDGTGTLRFGEQSYPIGPMDIIACPPGGPEVAHQIINSGSTELRYRCLSTVDPVEVCEQPDSDKLLVLTGPQEARTLRHVGRKQDAVDYWEGEQAGE
ncbi:cupin domain-containing protein [Shewanella sp. FJAT-52076]|uniref:cupin domain-containing protein n=1 Tax=Shewanella sp. FJAT-52076 TaxID=2864202 RepID=UPI001C65BCF9|nr:cupin domain-containing protein [Shewanella sp. FJAT-52076]QYJ74934.1 cupin domain-containing protein [Shewanella sp. FJAT-52076]